MTEGVDGDAWRADLTNRLADQRRSHWLEFCLIVVSINSFAAVALAARTVHVDAGLLIGVDSWLVILASSCAVMLAYTTIMYGNLFHTGVMSVGDVVFGFTFALTQFALFLIPATSDEGTTMSGQVDVLRWWLLAFSAWAWLGGFLSWHYMRSDRASSGQRLAVFWRRQRENQLFAATSGFVVFLMWVLSWPTGRLAVTGGVVAATFSSVAGLVSQQRSTRALREAAGC